MNYIIFFCQFIFLWAVSMITLSVQAFHPAYLMEVQSLVPTITSTNSWDEILKIFVSAAIALLVLFISKWIDKYFEKKDK